MFNLSLALSIRRRSGGIEPLLSLDLDPPPKKRKQKDPPPPLDGHVAGDPNLGSRLEHAIEVRAQQVQQQVRDEQTPVKERIEHNHSDIESAKGSSSADDDSALESAKGSGSNPIIDLSPVSIVKENPKGTVQKWDDQEDELPEGDDGITTDEEDDKDKESAN
jgi:hypothetical protein